MAQPTKRKVFDGRYEILSIVGRGACSVVYHARHVASPTSEVALKVLVDRKGYGASSDRLRKEALAMVSARHKYVIRLDDFHSVDKLCYLSMEYAPESDLRAYSTKLGGKLSVPQAERFLIQITEALSFIHQAGITHRDIKPENILVISEKQVRLGDFGVAVLPGEPSSIEELQKGVGTMDYMAPEVFEGTAYDKRSDIYALGVTFYELLSGTHPFANVPLASVLDVRQDEKIQNLAEKVPNLPPHIAAAIMRCMAYDAFKRFPSGKELLTALISPDSSSEAKVQRPAIFARPEPMSRVAPVVTTPELQPGLKTEAPAIEPVAAEEIVIDDYVDEPDDPNATEEAREPELNFLEEEQPRKKRRRKRRRKKKRDVSTDLAAGQEADTNKTETSAARNVASAAIAEEIVAEPDLVEEQHAEEPAIEDVTDEMHEPEFSEQAAEESVEEPPVQERFERGGSRPTRTLNRDERERALQQEYEELYGDNLSNEDPYQSADQIERDARNTIASEPRYSLRDSMSRSVKIGILIAGLIFFDLLLRGCTERSLVQRALDTVGVGGSSTVLPKVAEGELTFPQLAPGVYSGTIRGLIPGNDFPITLISLEAEQKLTVLLGIEGWKPISIPLNQNGNGDKARGKSNEIRVRSNGFVLSLFGDIQDGMIVGSFVNVITKEEGTWEARPLR